MVVIAERVWDSWHRREAEERKPTIALLFSSATAPEAALGALAEAMHDVMRERVARAREARPGELGFQAGHCSFVSVPEGVALRIDEGPEDFEGLLRGIAAGLERRDIDGEFDLYEPKEVAELPELIDLLEGHIRVNGQRVSRPIGGYLWIPDSDAVMVAADAGIAWCRGNDPELPLSLVVGLMPPTRLSAGDDVRRYLGEGINATRTVGVIHLTMAAPDRFRTFALKPSSGRVALIEGGSAVKENWHSSLARVNEAVIGSAKWAVYGYVKRGSRRLSSILGTSLADDWVRIPHMNPEIGLYEAFEDEYCPDVFGAQLLGNGYRGRIPDGADWRLERLRSGHVFVEHADPGAWFDGTLVAFGGGGSGWVDEAAAPTPRPVSRGREAFAAILFRDEFAAE